MLKYQKRFGGLVCSPYLWGIIKKQTFNIMKNSVKDPKREKALDKIRKMMALANDPNASEGEIENALKFSQNLMAKFSIENDEVDLSPDDIDILEQDNVRLQCERKYWSWDLLHILADSNDCTVIRSQRSYIQYGKIVKQTFYKIIGTRDDRVLTNELFNLTVPVIRNLYEKRFKERRQFLKENPLEAILHPLPVKHFFIASYIEGFLIGLALKLKEAKKIITIEDKTEKYGLMVIRKDELVQNFIKENMKKLKESNSTSSRQSDAASFNMGVKDGKDNHNKKLA